VRGLNVIDSHCHLDNPQFDPDREAVIDRALAAGVERMVVIGTGEGPPDLEAGIRLADKHESIYATVGVHPHDASKATRETFRGLRELLKHPKVIALGEIGLDYHYDHSPREIQRDVFLKQMLIAGEARTVRRRDVTGDRKAAAEHMKAELQLDDVRAELKPEQKVAAIRELTQQGKKVAMIGDGVNDAPSLAIAHIGVAMGARGSDAALEQADVVLMHDRLENFLAAFRLSHRARAVIRQNLFISLGTVCVLVTFALLGKIPLTLGVVGHEGSTVVVVMNSLRLLFGKISTPGGGDSAQMNSPSSVH